MGLKCFGECEGHCGSQISVDGLKEGEMKEEEGKRNLGLECINYLSTAALLILSTPCGMQIIFIPNC